MEISVVEGHLQYIHVPNGKNLGRRLTTYI